MEHSGYLGPENGKVHDPEGVYPLNWDSNDASLGCNVDTNAHTSEVSGSEVVYPDFQVWNQTEEDDLIMITHLQKGYVKPPLVNDEGKSGKQLVTDLLKRYNQTGTTHPSNNPASASHREMQLELMGEVFVEALHKRRIFNSIKNKGAFKPPSRVTLTEHKKEIWLKKLADYKVPLNDLSRTIPHGLRNKLLLEQCIYYDIPIHRAVWLIRCVSSNEQRQLKRKSNNNNNSSTTISNSSTSRWVIEWTEQITTFFENIIEQCFASSVSKVVSKKQFDYAIELIVNLYAEDLMSRVTFLTWVSKYTSFIVNNAKGFIDLKILSVHLSVIKLFWFKLIKFDYLSKELGESMLLILSKIHQFTRSSNKYDKIGLKLSVSFQYLIKYLFYYNPDTFILPSKWKILKSYLKKSLDVNLASVNDQFKLISYRNESLIIDEFDRSNISTSNNDYISNDKFSLILNKLNNSTGESISSLSKIIFEDNTSPDLNSSWKMTFNLIFEWCIQSNRNDSVNSQRISLICSILQFRLNQLVQSKSKKYKQFKVDLESIIIEFVYSMSEILNYKNEMNPKGKLYDVNHFLILINRLYQMNLFIISSYFRRLIASGVIYLSEPDRTCYIHILILNSLPDLKDANLKSILKRLIDSTDMKLKQFDLDLIKQSKLQTLNSLFDPNSNDSYMQATYTQYHQDELSFIKDPINIQNFFEIGRFFSSNFMSKFKQSDQLVLSPLKLSLMYECFEKYYNGLPQFLNLIIDTLDKDAFKNVHIQGHETIQLLLKMIISNFSLLKSSIFNQRSNIWDNCANILLSWIPNNRYNIIENLNSLTIPKQINPFFETKVALFSSAPLIEYLTHEELLTLDIASYERLSNAAEFNHHATLAITRYANIIKGVNANDAINLPIIIKFLKSIQKWKFEEFTKCVYDHINRFLIPILWLDYEQNLKLIFSLISSELISIKGFMHLLQHNSTSRDLLTGNFANNTLRLYWDLFYNLDAQFNNFTFIDGFNYSYAINVYKSENSAEYFKILSEIIYSVCAKKNFHNRNSNTNHLTSHDDPNVHHSIAAEQLVVVDDNTSIPVPTVSTAVDSGVNVGVGVGVGVDVMNSFPDLEVPEISSNQHNVLPDSSLNDAIVDTLWDLVTCHINLFIEMFYVSYDQYNFVDLKKLQSFIIKNVMKIEVSENGQADEILMIINNVNYFNLVISQWVFTYTMKRKYHRDMNFNLNSLAFNTLIENILQIAEKDTNEFKHKLIGELFIYFPDNYKEKLLSSCEEVYLNSETFPTLTLNNGNNATLLLQYILSSCSRLQNDDLKLEMSDALVFSLNSGLEKIILTCNNLEHQKRRHPAKSRPSISTELEVGIVMVSKIVLLHRHFLVDLILKRSINLQRDILIINLMKIFNHKIMIKNPRLKNLLYDVLISIKLIISEKITQQFQRSSSGNNSIPPSSSVTCTNTPQLNNTINGRSTPTSNSLFSPLNSPKPASISMNKSASILAPQQQNLPQPPIGGGSGYIIMPNILNIKPPNFNNNLKSLLGMFNLKDTIPENCLRLYTVNEYWDGSIDDDEGLSKFNQRPFDLIEDAQQDPAISLQLFGLSAQKENPR